MFPCRRNQSGTAGSGSETTSAFRNWALMGTYNHETGRMFFYLLPVSFGCVAAWDDLQISRRTSGMRQMGRTQECKRENMGLDQRWRD